MGSSWGLLGPSWRALGAFWGALGTLLGRLEGVLGALGRLLGRLRADQNVTQITGQNQTAFGSKRGGVSQVFWGGFGSRKSTKIGPKTSQNLRRFSRSKKLRFKSLLEPSWADLGAFGRSSWEPNMRSGTRGLVFGEKSRF